LAIGRKQGLENDEEKERRYYRGPNEKYIQSEAEYMTASQPKFAKNDGYRLQYQAGSIYMAKVQFKPFI
jgi:hypothetical protein